MPADFSEPTFDQDILFLQRLDDADFDVTDWEAEFIESALKKARYRTEIQPSFSPKQKEVIQKLRDRYADRLPVGKGEERRARGQVQTPEPVAGKCGYLVKGEIHQVRCGSVATVAISIGAAPGKLELCDDHAREREQRLAKMREQKRRDQ